MGKVYLIVVLIVCYYACGGNGIPSQWFSKNSAWNALLPNNAPLNPKSAELVTALVNQVKKYGPWINWVQYSVPVYTVPSTQPFVRVNLTNPSESQCVEELRQAFERVPLPNGADPAAGTDKHLVVWQPETNTMWEFWAMEKNSSGAWESRWGGKMDNVTSNPGFYTRPCTAWGGTATSLPLVGGLMMIDEIKAGSVEHALPLAVVETLKGVIIPPAERSDGWSTNPDAIPEGTRFRLPADLDIPSLNLNPFGQIMAIALQKYGGLVRDTAGAVVGAYCEPPPKGQPDPYEGPNGFFKGSSPDKILSLQNFPWDKMQVVDESWQPWNH